MLSLFYSCAVGFISSLSEREASLIAGEVMPFYFWGDRHVAKYSLIQSLMLRFAMTRKRLSSRHCEAPS